jgi:oligopeptide transport system substrate-binding protein
MGQMRVKKGIAIALVAMVFVLCLSALGCCRMSATGGLTLYGSEPSTLNPALCADATSGGYIVEIFSGLVTLNNNLEVIPNIAESWDVSADGKTYTFHLRDGVKFHNGKELTASDFKYSIERAADPDTGSPVAEAYLGDIVGVKEKLRGEAEEVAGVVVKDDKTLQLTIDAAKAYFVAKLSHPTAFVVDKENVEATADWWRFPNGTGPFKFREWWNGQRLVLERNNDFYGDVAKLEMVTFLFTGSSMMMYEKGQIDITQVSTSNIERVLDPTNPLNEEVVIVPELSLSYIGFNTAMSPFDDEKVRQAMCHAVDKEEIIEILAKDTVSPAYGILPPGIPGYSEEVEGLSYDVARAQQLIAESEYQDGLPTIVLSVPGSGSEVSASTEAIAWMWQENLGVEVEIEVVEFDTFLDDLWEGRFQAFEIAWLADYPDAENFLDLLFHSESVENHTGYSSPYVDQLLEEARVESDFDSRLAVYQEVEQAIVQDAPFLPLWFGRSYYLVKPYVGGFYPAPMIIPTLEDVWLQK